MLNENETLTQAARAMRGARVHPDVLERAETAILPRVGRHPAFVRPLLVGATGLAAWAVGAAVLAPVRASAGEVLRIAGNGDRGLRHVEASIVQPDGSLKLGYEMFLQGGKRRFAFATGEVAVYDGHALYERHADGAVTVERQKSGYMAEEGSARDLFAVNASGEGVRLTVQRGAVDRYTIDREVTDAGGALLHERLVLDADPKTERPLALRAKTDGSPQRVTTWAYPAPDPTLFRPLSALDGRVFDLDAQRNAVLSQLRSTGRRATVGGKTVELLGLWVDEAGRASAVARADYAYPEDYGLQIEGMAAHRPEKPPFSGQWMIHEPTRFEGRWTQVFGLARPSGAGAFRYLARVDVRVPVCEGKRFLGYARFEDVPVHRSYEVYFLQKGDRPFWDERKRPESVATKAVEESSRP